MRNGACRLLIGMTGAAERYEGALRDGSNAARAAAQLERDHAALISRRL